MAIDVRYSNTGVPTRITVSDFVFLVENGDTALFLKHGNDWMIDEPSEDALDRVQNLDFIEEVSYGQ